MRAGLALQFPDLDLTPDQPVDGLGPAWTRIDHVPFGATVDIEHVLLSEAGVVVFTTMADDEELGHAISEARWRARKVMALVGRVAWVPALPVLGRVGARGARGRRRLRDARRRARRARDRRSALDRAP